MDFYYIFGVWILDIFFSSVQDNSSMNIRTGWKIILYIGLPWRKNQRNNIFFFKSFYVLNFKLGLILMNFIADWGIRWGDRVYSWQSFCTIQYLLKFYIVFFFFCFISNQIVTRTVYWHHNSLNLFSFSGDIAYTLFSIDILP